MDKSDQAEKNVQNQVDEKQKKWQDIQSASGDDVDLPEEAPTEPTETLSLENPNLSDTEKKLLESEQKANEYWNDKMRLAAEMQNLTRRHQKELTNRAKFANEDFAKSLLEVMDSCVEGLKLDIDQNNAAAKATHEGLELIYKQMLSVFKRFKIDEINPLDQPFNPELHQAMLAQPADAPENTVIEVIQKGYQMHERILRPARVIVSKGNG